MGLGWELARAEMAHRKGTFAALALALALAVASGSLALGLVDGVESAITRQVRDTVTGDVRATRGPTDLGAGEPTDALAPLAQRLRDAGAEASLRLELKGIVSNGSSVAAGTGVLLVGIGEDDVLPLEDHLVRGEQPRPDRVWVDGRSYVPVVLGSPLLRSLDLDVHPGHGPVEGSMRVNVTAGHLSFSDGSLVPVVRPGLVVGTFETGFRAVDRSTAFIPIEAARELVGRHPHEPVGNAVVATTSDPTGLRDRILDDGFNATTAEGHQQASLGPIYDALTTYTGASVALLLLLGAAWVGTAMATAIGNDGPRLATLLAVGLSPRLLRRSWLAAALATGAAGALLGALVAVLASWLVPGLSLTGGALSGLEVLVRVDAATIATLGLLALGVAVAAARLALIKLDRLPIVETLKS